jgi:hypothetical protein
MAVKTLKHDDRRGVRTAFRGSPSQCDVFEALGKSDIAELSAAPINKIPATNWCE